MFSWTVADNSRKLRHIGREDQDSDNHPAASGRQGRQHKILGTLVLLRYFRCCLQTCGQFGCSLFSRKITWSNNRFKLFQVFINFFLTFENRSFSTIFQLFFNFLFAKSYPKVEKKLKSDFCLHQFQMITLNKNKLKRNLPILWIPKQRVAAARASTRDSEAESSSLHVFANSLWRKHLNKIYCSSLRIRYCTFRADNINILHVFANSLCRKYLNENQF